MPPPTSGKRIVIVAPCSGSPTVLPVQVVENGGTAGTGPQGKVSTLVVVGMNTRGMPSGKVAAGPVAVKVKFPELVLFQGPVTPPVALQT